MKNKGADQTAYPCSLISTFVFRSLGKYSSLFCNMKKNLTSIVAEWTGLSLTWSQTPKPGPEVKLFSCSTQLSMKCSLLINVKMPTIVGILTYISMINTTSERLKARHFFICQYFSFLAAEISCSVELSMKKVL